MGLFLQMFFDFLAAPGRKVARRLIAVYPAAHYFSLLNTSPPREGGVLRGEDSVNFSVVRIFMLLRVCDRRRKEREYG
jgi:hypothetical protein